MSRKNGFFVLDIESMGVESNSVILSIAILYVDMTTPQNWESLYSNTIFVKLSVKEQVQQYNRTIDKDTVTWWNKQCDLVKAKSFFPSKDDMHVVDAIKCLRNFIIEQNDPQTTSVFTRGSLDQLALDSLTKVAGEELLFPYANYMDVRTYVNLMAEKPYRGYCDVPLSVYPNNDKNVVMKHNPVDDVCLDALMILNAN